MGRANTEYKTEKRKANVGDRILITNANSIAHDYKNGDVGEVYDHCDMFDDLVYVKGWTFAVRTDEYEVIVEEITQTPTHNEKLVLTRLIDAEAAIERVTQSIDELKRKVETLEKVEKFRKFDEVLKRIAEITANQGKGVVNTIKTPNDRRADVIKQAKEFVEDLLAEVDGQLGWAETDIPVYADWGRLRVEFVVNNEKRTVVALARLGNIPEDTEVVGKGIAQCTTDDVFNADIGKAIALGRALGVYIPHEFLDAPQPTEVVVGMRVGGKPGSSWLESPYEVIRVDDGNAYDVPGSGHIPLRQVVIHDDSEAVYG